MTNVKNLRKDSIGQIIDYMPGPTSSTIKDVGGFFKYIMVNDWCPFTILQTR